MKKTFSNIKVYEFVLMAIFILSVIVVGAICSSPIIVIINSLISIISVFLITKGNYLGNVLQIVYSLIYSYIAFINQYYGEVIFFILVNLPIYICSTIFWLKNRNVETNEIRINTIKLKEYLLLFIVGVVGYVVLFFLLKSLNTANIYLGTLSLIIGSIAGYLSMRRCEYNFIVYILLNVIGIMLWFSVVISDISNLPTMLIYIINLFMNISGIINWKRLKIMQTKKTLQ